MCFLSDNKIILLKNNKKMNKTISQSNKEPTGNSKVSYDLQTSSSLSTESSIDIPPEMDEHFKYLKILLDYNIIDFTCKHLI